MYDIACMIFCGILNDGLSKVVKGYRIIREEHNGLRVDRRGRDNMYVVNKMTDKARKDGRKNYLSLLYIEKAYHRVARKTLW